MSVKMFSEEAFKAARAAFNEMDGASIAAWQEAVDAAQANGYQVHCDGALGVKAATLVRPAAKAATVEAPKPKP